MIILISRGVAIFEFIFQVTAAHFHIPVKDYAGSNYFDFIQFFTIFEK